MDHDVEPFFLRGPFEVAGQFRELGLADLVLVQASGIPGRQPG